MVAGTLRVAQVAEETSGATVLRAYPKTRAGRRTVPMAPFLVAELRAHLGRMPAEPDSRALVFGTRTGTALRRSNFRRQVWRPALVRAGLLGQVVRGLRFHHLRHSYATWLVTAGVPVNVTQTVMGHDRPSTTLNVYTHVGTDFGDAARAAFGDLADDPLTSRPDEGNSGSSEGGSDGA